MGYQKKEKREKEREREKKTKMFLIHSDISCMCFNLVDKTTTTTKG